MIEANFYHVFLCFLPIILNPELRLDCQPTLFYKENPIYVLLFWELRGLSPNFHVHVSMSDFYIPRIGPHISLQQNRQTNPGNI
jgi:hypothetical protein